ncbi:glycoside hydrolase family 5 protein [Anaerosacchariphilus polymeriproducens]|nr:glycoside hydrolase family 5 protein [Anaerosacchariphilus polymeriproducens]
MKKKSTVIMIMTALLVICMFLSTKECKAMSQTPFSEHGKLSVQGTQLVDKNGQAFQLKGVSTHGIAWFPDYVNKDAFQTIRDWGGNLIRLSLYTEEYNGYLTGGNQGELKSLIDKGVKAATDLGMYVVIDWHILNDGNPNTHKEEAKKFFAEMAEKYASYDNVIYEICNEPNGGTSWSDIKTYAQDVIPVIRNFNKNAVIIVGTPTWSQDVDVASKDPLSGNNLMYACHFYAATHKQEIRDKVQTALNNGLPIFVSEFSICDSSGGGQINTEEAENWMNFLNQNQISYTKWNLSNKSESSALIKNSNTSISGWTDNELTDAGKWIKQQLGN